MRIDKIVTISSGVTTNYRYAYEGGWLHKMTRGKRILEFSHDTNGTLLNLKDAVLRNTQYSIFDFNNDRGKFSWLNG